MLTILTLRYNDTLLQDRCRTVNVQAVIKCFALQNEVIKKDGSNIEEEKVWMVYFTKPHILVRISCCCCKIPVKFGTIVAHCFPSWCNCDLLVYSSAAAQQNCWGAARVINCGFPKCWRRRRCGRPLIVICLFLTTLHHTILYLVSRYFSLEF